MEAAKKISGEEERARAMKEANEILGPLMSRLGAIDRKIEALKNKVNSREMMSVELMERADRSLGITSGNAAIRRAESKLVETRIETDADAWPHLNNVERRLDRAYDEVKEVHDRLRKKRKEREGARKAEKAASKAPKNAAKKK